VQSIIDGLDKLHDKILQNTPRLKKDLWQPKVAMDLPRKYHGEKNQVIPPSTWCERITTGI